MAVMSEMSPDGRLSDRFCVEWIDSAAQQRHKDFCVLDPEHDPIAGVALQARADDDAAAPAGLVELAADLHLMTSWEGQTSMETP